MNGRCSTARPTWRRRMLALLAGGVVPLVLLAGMWLPTSLGDTEAGWVTTTSVQGTAQTAVIPPIDFHECHYRPGIIGLGARVEITWSPPEGYGVSSVDAAQYTNGLGSVLQPITGFTNGGGAEEEADGSYTTTIRTGLLGGSLGLGSTMHFVLTVEDSSGWTSEPVVVIATSGILIGIGSNCGVLE